MTATVYAPVPKDMDRAVEALRGGGLVAFPTETVYGLGGDASNPSAVARIFAAKGRPADHPVIVHVGDVAALPLWSARVPDVAWALADVFWPGPLTLILPRAPGVSNLVTGARTRSACACRRIPRPWNCSGRSAAVCADRRPTASAT